jgi:hypothetical protein
MRDLELAREIENPDNTLTTLFPVSTCVGIGGLAVSFFLLFRTLRTNEIDLRFAAHLFARGTPRYKSTLCKLYQITYVLCAAGVLNRTPQVCEVTLLDPYIDFTLIPAHETFQADPVEIDSLLNHRRPGDIAHILRRRRELQHLFVKGVAKRASAAPSPRSLMAQISWPLASGSS